MMNTEHTAPLKIDVISDTEQFRSMQDAWNNLNGASRKGTLFSSWEWLFSWWEIYKQDGKRELLLLCAYRGDKLVGIAPLNILHNAHRQFPCNRQLMLLGTGETDGALVLTEYLDLIIQPDEESPVLDAFSQHLQDSSLDWHGATFPQQLDDCLLSKLFANHSQHISGAVKADGFRTLIELPETYKDYLMSLKKKKRNNITRMFTRLQNEQNFQMVSTDDGLETDYAIAEIGKLNRQRRENLEQPSAFHSLRFERFHRLVAKRLLSLNKVQIRLLTIDDKVVAGLYSMIDGEIQHAYQCGFDTELGDRYALMTMMITQEISHCIENPAVKFFNFMYSDDENSYKLRYSAYTEPMYQVGFQRKDLRGNSYRLLHDQLKPRIKRILKNDASAVA